MEAAIKPDDNLITAYRCHTFAVQRGGTIKGMLAELMGRGDGMSKGKGGSMHVYTPNFFGGNGIVGAQVPLGAGLAFAQKYNKSDHATFALYGDGASNQGQVFEAFNMAQLWKLPCVFICENNKYGMSMSSEKAFKVEHLSEKAGGFGIPGETVDGNDVEAVHEAVARAVQRARAGEGPTLIEALTYRWRGHSKSDKNLYRTREEIAQWRADDPIAAYADVLLKRGEFTHEQLNAVTDEVRNEIREAVRFGTRGEEPTVEAMMQGIYAPSPVDARELGARA